MDEAIWVDEGSESNIEGLVGLLFGNTKARRFYRIIPYL